MPELSKKMKTKVGEEPESKRGFWLDRNSGQLSYGFGTTHGNPITKEEYERLKNKTPADRLLPEPEPEPVADAPLPDATPVLNLVSMKSRPTWLSNPSVNPSRSPS